MYSPNEMISVSSCRAVQMFIDMLISPFRQLYFLPFIVASGRYIRFFLLCAGFVAPCHAVFVVDARRKHARIHVYRGPLKQKVSTRRLLKKERKEEFLAGG